MSARVLDGREVAAVLKDELRAEVAGRSLELAIVRGGGDEAAEIYARRLEALCEDLGVGSRVVEVPDGASSEDAIALVSELNADPAVTGILVQLPLPAGLDDTAVVAAVDPAKDVDGVNPENAGRLYLGLPALAPATPLAVTELLRRYDVPIEGRRAVVVGRSNITGKPLALLLLREHATVTVCHSRTADLGAVIREGELVVSAVGRPGLVRGDMIAPGAVVVDVGTNVVDGKLVVPGGVGPLTNLMLVRNVLRASELSA